MNCTRCKIFVFSALPDKGQAKENTAEPIWLLTAFLKRCGSYTLSFANCLLFSIFAVRTVRCLTLSRLHCSSPGHSKESVYCFVTLDRVPRTRCEEHGEQESIKLMETRRGLIRHGNKVWTKPQFEISRSERGDVIRTTCPVTGVLARRNSKLRNDDENLNVLTSKLQYCKGIAEGLYLDIRQVKGLDMACSQGAHFSICDVQPRNCPSALLWTFTGSFFVRLDLCCDPDNTRMTPWTEVELKSKKGKRLLFAACTCSRRAVHSNGLDAATRLRLNSGYAMAQREWGG